MEMTRLWAHATARDAGPALNDISNRKATKPVSSKIIAGLQTRGYHIFFESVHTS